MSTDRKTQMSKLMQNAWMLVKKYGLSMRDAMVKAWGIFKLKDLMLRGIVKFFYTKIDGSTRMAWGTLKADLLPQQPGDGKQRKKNDTLFTYYDSDKQAFRSFKHINFINIA